MHLILAEPTEPLWLNNLATANEYRFAPPWSLLCIQACINARTRHRCRIFDARVHADPEQALREHLQPDPELPVLAIQVTAANLEGAVALLQCARHHQPDLLIILIGSAPTHFPQELMAFDQADYLLRGDPESTLKHILDNADVPQRLNLLHGLCPVAASHDAGMVEPHWLDDLRGITLTDWNACPVADYKAVLGQPFFEAEARLSRGHSHLPCDRAFGHGAEPLRFHPPEQIIQSMQLCTTSGASHLFFSDPPGIWDPERLQHWLLLLKQMQNHQPWGFQLLPTHLDPATIEDLSLSFCRRIDFLFPSCDPDVLRSYGVILDPEEFRLTVRALHAKRIHVAAVFWMGGPGEAEGEERRIVTTVEALRHIDFSIEPFPLQPTAPLSQQHREELVQPDVAARVHHILQRNEEPLPPWFWSADPALTQRIEKVQRALRRSPRRLLNKFFGRKLRAWKERAIRPGIPSSYAPLDEKKPPPKVAQKI